MSPVTVQNEDKENCLLNTFRKTQNFKQSLIFLKNSASTKEEFWTAGKESKCAGKFEWCSHRVFFSIRQKVNLNTVVSSSGKIKLCVFGTLSAVKLLLSASGCDEKKNIICEVRNKFLCGFLTVL